MSGLPGWAPAVVAGYTPREDEATTVFIKFSAPGYFRTMGIPLLAGRDFEHADRTEKLTKAIVNRRFAERFFKGRNPIGETFRVGNNRDLLLVGVVQDTNLTSFREVDRDIVYYPLPTTFRGTIVARAKPGFTAAAAASAIRTAVAAVDSRLEVTTGEMEELVQTSLARDGSSPSYRPGSAFSRWCSRVSVCTASWLTRSALARRKSAYVWRRARSAPTSYGWC